MNKYTECKRAFDGERFKRDKSIDKLKAKRTREFLASCLQADLQLDGRKKRGAIDNRIDRDKLTQESLRLKNNGVTYKAQALELGVTGKQLQRALRERQNIYKIFADTLINYFGDCILS